MMSQARTASLATILVAAAWLLATPDRVRGDGLPVPVDQDVARNGIASPDETVRYVTLPGRRETALLEIATEGGRIERVRTLDGRLSVPAVAVDGTTSGLSASGETLVLIEPRRAFPRERTRLVVVDGERPRGSRRAPQEIVLRGDFSFDAISPDGRTIYLVEYPNRIDPSRYRVRALDRATGALRAEPILDTEEATGAMRGFPLTRLTGAGGRWEYTLYDGGGGEPFIHALDVTAGETVCIDLPMLTPDLAATVDLGLGPAGAAILVTRRGELLASVDPATFAVTEPSPEKPDAAPSGFPWAPVGAAVGLIAICAVLLRRRSGRRSASAAAESELEDLERAIDGTGPASPEGEPAGHDRPIERVG